jgi:hypothetical protein
MASSSDLDQKNGVDNKDITNDISQDTMTSAEKAKQRNDQKHDIEQNIKDTELKRKAEYADKERNLLKVKQFDRSIKPAIKREQDQLKQQLRKI